MGYTSSRSAKITVCLLLCGSLTFLFGRPHWEAMKEEYFHRVFGMCAKANGASKQKWDDVDAFDASIRQFVARNMAGQATIDCANRWTSWVTDYVTAPDGGASGEQTSCSLSVIISGQNFNPPQHIFEIERKTCPSPLNGD